MKTINFWLSYRNTIIHNLSQACDSNCIIDVWNLWFILTYDHFIFNKWFLRFLAANCVNEMCNSRFGGSPLVLYHSISVFFRFLETFVGSALAVAHEDEMTNEQSKQHESECYANKDHNHYCPSRSCEAHFIRLVLYQHLEAEHQYFCNVRTCSCNECKEDFVVALAYARAQPDAVVIKAHHTVAAIMAVTRSQWPEDVAWLTELQFSHVRVASDATV